MAMWADNVKFVKDIIDSKYQKIDTALLFFFEPPEEAGVASSSLAAAFLLPLLLGVPSFLAFSASFMASLFFLARSAFSFSSISLFSFSMREMRVLHLLCSSIAVLDLMNQSKRNWGAFLTAALSSS